MARVICGSCKTSFLYSVIKGMEACPVCGKPLWDDTEDTEKVDNSGTDMQSTDEHADWITWYYYGHKSNNGKTTSLRDKPIDLNEHGDTFFLIKEFKAPPRDSSGSSEKAKEILRTYVPDAFKETKKVESSICCPWCGSSEFTLLNRGYSILTGFLGSGKVKRVCNNCKKEF